MSLCEIIEPIGLDYTRERQTAALARRLITARPADWAMTRRQWVVPFTGSDPERAGRLSLGAQPPQRDTRGQQIPAPAAGIPAPSAAPGSPPISGPAAGAGESAAYREHRSYTITLGDFGFFATSETYLATTDPIPWDFEILGVGWESIDNLSQNPSYNLFLTPQPYNGTRGNIPGAPLIPFHEARAGGVPTNAQRHIGPVLLGTAARGQTWNEHHITCRNSAGMRIGLAYKFTSGGAPNAGNFTIDIQRIQPEYASNITQTAARTTSRAAVTPAPAQPVARAVQENAARIANVAPPAPPPPPPPDPCAGADIILRPGETKLIAGGYHRNAGPTNVCYFRSPSAANVIAYRWIRA